MISLVGILQQNNLLNLPPQSQEGTIAYRTRSLTGKEVPHLIQW
ncbi:hypothetical protein TIFTF001_056465 [Ficus carica]|uniref:Uncharacterized protein n=1 Tax=Ficus carica TaxID=3494 RepID=A0AA88EIN1_FICCA|nr:hypothetical protein TIFTF001_056463 [Ficus carica]GMN75677.1 hypothetical protein TIFTF001_056465 [Ficus carica]